MLWINTKLSHKRLLLIFIAAYNICSFAYPVLGVQYKQCILSPCNSTHECKYFSELYFILWQMFHFFWLCFWLFKFLLGAMSTLVIHVYSIIYFSLLGLDAQAYIFSCRIVIKLYLNWSHWLCRELLIIYFSWLFSYRVCYRRLLTACVPLSVGSFGQQWFEGSRYSGTLFCFTFGTLLIIHSF